MKAKVLKSFIPTNSPTDPPQNTGITGGMIFKGAIIDVDVPVGGKKVYYTKKGTNVKTELIIGTDVELILDDGAQPIEVNKQQKGSLLFYGGLIALTYIVYKIVTTK
jgi:hypothetical protein